MTLRRLAQLVVVGSLLVSNGCSDQQAVLGGYTVLYADRGKAWLQNPDGTIAHDGLLQQLYRDERHILIVSNVIDDRAIVRPLSSDGGCLAAQLIDSRTHKKRQIRLAEAIAKARTMMWVASTSRKCSGDLPTGWPT